MRACVATAFLISACVGLAQEDPLYPARRALGTFSFPELRAHLDGERAYKPTAKDRTELLGYVCGKGQSTTDFSKWRAAVDLLLEKGGKLNPGTEGVAVPLMLAAGNWSDRYVSYLLARGARPDATTPSRGRTGYPETALWAATCSQDADQRIPRYRAGAPTDSGETGVQAIGRFRRTVGALLDAGADPMRPAYVGEIPFQKMCYWGETGLVRHMVRKGARPNARGMASRGRDDFFRSYTALHCAALRDSKENAETVRALLALGADPRVKDETGRTPLQLARQKGHRLVAEALGG